MTKLIICLTTVLLPAMAAAQTALPEYREKWEEVETHIRNSWLKYVDSVPGSLPRPYSYALNPGTLYYWDMYFINEGLMAQGFMEQARNNIDDFIYEIEVIRTDGAYRAQQRFGLYRWHIADPVRFEKDLKVTIQDLGWRHGGSRYLLQQSDIASVVYWYQTEPHNRFPKLPAWEALEVN
jgi:hypothetical protein